MASIPSTINDALSDEVSTSQKNIILSGFGVGLSWASASITLDSIYCPPVKTYNQGEMNE